MPRHPHPTDRQLRLPQLAVIGLQHVLVMYAGAVAVPLIVSDALGLTGEQRTLLINADLFACGLATLVQALGFPGVGIRLPVMMGVSFASVTPILALGGASRAAGESGADALLGIYGAVIVAGLFRPADRAALAQGGLLRFFPPVVTGTIITVIGISLMPTAVRWIGGGSVTVKRPLVGGGFGDVPNPAFGQLDDLAIAFAVLVAIVLIARFARGFWANISVLLGIALGGVVAAMVGKIDLAPVAAAQWLDLVYPFRFGVPRFELWSALTMCLVMIVIMVESTGMFLALGAITGERIGADRLSRGLRADGVGTVIGGVFNAFLYTSFSQNVGLVGVTGVRSRWVAVAGAVVLLILGMIPKLAALVAAIPPCTCSAEPAW